MAAEPPEWADLAPSEPCCAETAGGPFEQWAHWATDAHLLLTATRMARACPADEAARAICADVAQAAWDQLGYRSGGLVPHRTSPLPPCDCPGGPNDC